ncbi:MAG: alpha-L-fucosidase [Armatimonadota bacterium]
MRRGLILLASMAALSCPVSAAVDAELARRAAWWTEARFGMFIHWGVYAVPADSTLLNGSRGAAEWYLTNKRMPIDDYRRFAARFNPGRYDAAQWVKIARQAGMRYIIITSKHHDGFCLWDSALTDWSISKATPFQRDALRELSRECRRQGMPLGYYYSIMDWSHPDYLPRRAWDTRPAEGADFERYVQYMKGQVRELIGGYGPVRVLWFDGEWEDTWTHERGVDLYNYVHTLAPDILINNRVDKGRKGMQGMTREGDFRGDFGTPEQEVPPEGFPDGRLWESCITINHTWGYAENDTDWKSSTQLIRLLCDVAGKGGNLLLNVGPKADGTFPEAITERLLEMGRWLQANGEAIYGTSAGMLKDLPEGVRCTRRGSTLYLHVFEWPEEGLTIRGVSALPVRARVLATGEEIPVARVGRTGIRVARPSETDPAVTVVRLDIGSGLR